MKRITILAMFLSGIVFGQNTMSSNSIESNFSVKSIQVYQENSESKVLEFYEYLSLYSKENDPNLKIQLVENLKSLIENQNLSLPDLTQNKNSKIKFPEFLKLIENQNYEFEIIDFKNSEEIGFNYWKNTYELKIKKGKDQKTVLLKQTIKFQPIEKRFGAKTKKVWTIQLADINQ